MKLIGINGFKESGKDTAYACIKLLISANGSLPYRRVERRAFADSLKIMAALSLGYEGNDDHLIACMNRMKEAGSVGSWLDTNEALDTCLTILGRRYLQNYGNHARRVFGDSFWVDQVVPIDVFKFRAVWETLGRSGLVKGMPYLGVVTDVRYPNEAERIREVDGEVWEIVRPGLESDGHASEQPLPRELVDVTITNDGTVDDLSECLWYTLKNRDFV